QISAYPGRTREQKELFAKEKTNAAIKILKAKLHHFIMTSDKRPTENWYIPGESSCERAGFEIRGMCMQHEEV
ncbi:MAG TPA: tautomerase family protein, partial [Candidatus Saccharimonadales bacterium]|nr:tautomerase family protein [Candidatus Saccharimonadales bacterium]